MPLKKSGSKESFHRNVAELIHAGHSVAQSLAISYKIKGENSASAGKSYAKPKKKKTKKRK